MSLKPLEFADAISNTHIDHQLVPTMLDHEVNVKSGWQTAWLDRTLPSLNTYLNVLSYGLSITIIMLGVMGYLAIRKSMTELNGNPSKRTEILSQMNKKVLWVTKRHFFVAFLYLVHTFCMTMVDAVISAGALRDDISSDPGAYTQPLLFEMVVYSIYLLVIFAAAFILVPTLQIVAVTYLLARFSSKHGSNALADYIPEARFFGTHIAQIWCMASFFVTGWWSPSSDGSFWRYVVLQACLGSSLAWLQASFALNFRADKLKDEDLQVSDGGVREILQMFGKTVKVVHTYSKSDALPHYEEVAQQAPEVVPTDGKE